MLVGILQGGQVLLGLAIAYLVVAHGLASPSATPVDEDRGDPQPGGASFGGAAAAGRSRQWRPTQAASELAW